MLGKQAPSRYELDLSNEVLYTIVGQEATKISEVKVGGREGIADSARFETDMPRAWLIWQIFYKPPTLTFDIFTAS